MLQIRGGMGIINPEPDRPGTIGLIATDGAKLYIVSCYHVLCRLHGDPFQQGEPIYLAEDMVRALPIAHTEKGMADLDIAAALVANGIDALAGIVDFSPLTAPVEPEEGMIVVKLGHATGLTEGIISLVDGAEVWIAPLPEGDGSPVSAGGDSGAVWVWKDTWAPVVLHNGTNDTGLITFARGLSLPVVLEALELDILTD